MARTGIVAVLLLACLTLGWGQWTKTTIYNYGGTVYRAEVGNVRNDGVKRLYVTVSNELFELSYERGTWVNRLIAGVPGTAYDVCIAPGRRDGRQRVYVACSSGHAYEFSYDSGNWVETDMGGCDYADADQIAFGYGRNDSILRAYVTHDDGHMFEYTWTNGAWSFDDLGQLATQLVDVAVGQTAHDSKVHVYASTQEGGIIEATYHNGWTSTQVDMLTPAPWGMEMGRATNQGCADDEGVCSDTGDYPLCPRALDLFVTSEGERDVWRYRWQNNGWRKVSLGQTGGQGYPRGSDVVLGFGRNDKVVRVYQVHKNTHVYEFSLRQGAWSVVDLGSGGTCSATGITIGAGRHDRVQRIYACFPSGELTEYSWTRTEVPIPATDIEGPGFGLRAEPNPFENITSIGFSSRSDAPMHVRICDANGRILRRLTTTAKAGVASWDGRDDAGQAVARGVYLARLQQENTTSTIRLVKLQ